MGVGAGCRDFVHRVLEVAVRRRLALSRHDLDVRLQQIDVEGWDGPTAGQLLWYVRENLVRIQVSAAGLSGPAADQAEATGWAAAWEVLTSAAIRTADWPWSVLWISVRRAVRGEWAAGQYLTKPRAAWGLRENPDAPTWQRSPVSLDPLLADGYEPAAAVAEPEQPILAGVVELLADVGWEPELAAQVVVRLAEQARPGPGGSIMGWRRVATELELPPWQTRRVVRALQAAAVDSLDGYGGDRAVDRSARLTALCATTTRYRGKSVGVGVIAC